MNTPTADARRFHCFIRASWPLLCGLLALAGCNREDSASAAAGAPPGTGGGKPLIALVVKTLNNPFFIDMQHGAEAAAKAQGVELTVQAAEREVDVERQVQIIENLIQRRVAALIISPSGSREIVEVIVKANQAGIPVIIVDTRADAAELKAAGGKIATFIGSDNYEGGKLAGHFMAERMKGQAKIAVLEGIPGHETGDARLRGFRDALAGQPGMQIVASQPANWERDQGFNVAQNLLQAHPEITGLFAASDLMALGAVEAIATAGRTGTITVVGFDALDEARQAIKKGTMAATVAQNPAKMGATGVAWAARILHGETPPPEVAIPIELVQ
jgi:ribose transport system substrate-binding protein